MSILCAFQVLSTMHLQRSGIEGRRMNHNRKSYRVSLKRPIKRRKLCHQKGNNCIAQIWWLSLRQSLMLLLTYRWAFVNGFHLSVHTIQQIRSVVYDDCGCLHAKSGTKKKKKGPGSNMVAVNRIAYRNYEVLDTFEAGISLLGTEVKSIRDGKLNLRDGYVKPAKNGRSCTLHNVHVGKCQYVGADYFQHEEKRPRSLLLHKSEARKLLQQTEQMGMTVIPLKAYWNEQNKLKIQIALCRGKNVRDKRATIQERDMKRETNRIIKNFRIA